MVFPGYYSSGILHLAADRALPSPDAPERHRDGRRNDHRRVDLRAALRDRASPRDTPPDHDRLGRVRRADAVWRDGLRGAGLRVSPDRWRVRLHAGHVFAARGLPVGLGHVPVSYTHLRAHETRHDLV